MGDQPTLLRVEDLRFGPPAALSHDSVSFQLMAGECLLVLGPNGVGKTSLLRTLLGLLPSSSGRVFWRGRTLSTLGSAGLARVAALVAQSLSETPDFTVRHYVLLGRLPLLGAYAVPGRQDHHRVAALLERLGIERLADQSLDQLSGGEQQLARLARALAQDARVLLLDEPAANLDPGNQVRLLQLLAQLRREGIALIMSTHDPWHAPGLADQLLMGMPRRRWQHVQEADLLTDDLLSSAYGVEFERAVTGAGVSVPVPRRPVDQVRYQGSTRRSDTISPASPSA